MGRPGEKLTPAGAGRLYVPGDRWQTVIPELLAASQYVVFVYGSTDGLLWEVQTIVEQVQSTKVIVCIPQGRRRENGKDAWRRFRDRTSGAFPKPLPDDPGASLLMHFDKSWQPLLVEPSRPYFLHTMSIQKGIRTILAREKTGAAGD